MVFFHPVASRTTCQASLNCSAVGGTPSSPGKSHGSSATGPSASRQSPWAVSSARRSRSSSPRAASTSVSVSSGIPKAIATRRRYISCIEPTCGVVRRFPFFGYGLRRPTRSDHRPIGNCASPATAASVDTRPIARSERPRSPR